MDDPPRPVQRQFVRRLSTGSNASSQFVGQRGRAAEVPDLLARTMSPGDLALAAGAELETMSLVCDSATLVPFVSGGVSCFETDFALRRARPLSVHRHRCRS